MHILWNLFSASVEVLSHEWYLQLEVCVYWWCPRWNRILQQTSLYSRICMKICLAVSLLPCNNNVQWKLQIKCWSSEKKSWAVETWKGFKIHFHTKQQPGLAFTHWRNGAQRWTGGFPRWTVRQFQVEVPQWTFMANWRTKKFAMGPNLALLFLCVFAG